MVRKKARSSFKLAMHAREQCFAAQVDGRVAYSNWPRFNGCGLVDLEAKTRDVEPMFRQARARSEAARRRESLRRPCVASDHAERRKYLQ